VPPVVSGHSPILRPRNPRRVQTHERLRVSHIQTGQLEQRGVLREIPFQDRAGHQEPNGGGGHTSSRRGPGLRHSGLVQRDRDGAVPGVEHEHSSDDVRGGSEGAVQPIRCH